MNNMNNKDTEKIKGYLSTIQGIDAFVDEENITIGYKCDDDEYFVVYINTQFYPIGDTTEQPQLYWYHIYLAIQIANMYHKESHHPEARKMLSFHNQILCFIEPVVHMLVAGDFNLYIEVWPELKIYVKSSNAKFRYIMITFDDKIYIDFVPSLASRCSKTDTIDTEMFAEYFIAKLQ